MTVRVLVVEDSVTVRRRLVEVLCADSEIEVVGETEETGPSRPKEGRIKKSIEQPPGFPEATPGNESPHSIEREERKDRNRILFP